MRVLSALAVGLTTLVVSPRVTLAQGTPRRRSEAIGIVRDYDGGPAGAPATVTHEPRVHLITAYDAGESAAPPVEARLAPVTIASDYDDPRTTITIADGRPYALTLITTYDGRASNAREEYLPPLAIIRDYDGASGIRSRVFNAAPFEIVIDFDDDTRTTLPAVIIAR